jgi:hypothetical protein
MQPFIRQRLNTYAARSGPNCMNAALSANAGHYFELEHVNNGSKLMARLRESGYRYVAPAEPLQTGDMLVYEVDGVLEHASIYITPRLIFNKLGLSQFSPYVFQTRAESEQEAFPDGRFNLMVFRPLKEGESAGSLYGPGIYYEKSRPPRAWENFKGLCGRVLRGAT